MFEIPAEHLPPGFAESVSDPPARPAPARPAATIVLLRDGDSGLEALLLRRHRSSGFVPGAWVFPGGRVDAGDSGPSLYERLRGMPNPHVPEPGFWTAGLRELFEETGVLLARHHGQWVADAASDRRIESFRRSLMDGTIAIGEMLEEMDAVLDASDMVHTAHWITPVVEPRRYDTHFFAARLPPDRGVRADPREMTDAAWLRPADALDRFRKGDMPMVFPTLKTLESLKGFGSTEHALDSLRHSTIPTILPRLVRTSTGVGIVVDEP